LLAKKYIKPNEVFAVSMGDLLGFGGKPFIQQLIEVFEDKKRPVVSVEEVPLEATSRFGVVDIKKSYKRLHEVRSIIEKPGPKLAPSRLALTGKYILTPDIFVYLENLVKNHILGEVKLADALKVYAEKKGILAYQCIGSIKDTGNKLDFLKAMIDLSLESKTFGSEVRKYLKSIRL
jgi:UTP--glucose-1-phosphate uridylyltransferase